MHTRVNQLKDELREEEEKHARAKQITKILKIKYKEFLKLFGSPRYFRMRKPRQNGSLLIPNRRKHRELSPLLEKININNLPLMKFKQIDYLRERIEEFKKAEEELVSSQKMCRAKEQEILSTKERIHAIKQETQQNYLNQKENKETNLRNARQRESEAESLLEFFQSKNEALNTLIRLKMKDILKGFHATNTNTRECSLINQKIPAFYGVLRNTLVANDIRQATRIAYGNRGWRVVTLDGELIEQTGCISGGGTKMSSNFLPT
ncbi:hypothetical protein C1645_741147 [Glomus cerebriforme]|uniref:Uncharacterized protein n=1 Tax=Glomus cerebriforme TaxID=658196 RepID=A0A397SIP3_9GLOM|nr:hypothetical protein C1645_741147 [Glomus cerebriforme]